MDETERSQVSGFRLQVSDHIQDKGMNNRTREYHLEDVGSDANYGEKQEVFYIAPLSRLHDRPGKPGASHADHLGFIR